MVAIARVKIKSFRSKEESLASLFLVSILYELPERDSSRLILTVSSFSRCNFILARLAFHSLHIFDVLDKTNQQYSRLRLFLANARIATITVHDSLLFLLCHGYYGLACKSPSRNCKLGK